MKLKELKTLVDEWIATGDWDEAEIELYSSRGFVIDEPIGIECTADMAVNQRDKLRFVND